jgi:hypothetical protein
MTALPPNQTAAMRNPLRNRDAGHRRTFPDKTLFGRFRAAHEKSPVSGALFVVFRLVF